MPERYLNGGCKSSSPSSKILHAGLGSCIVLPCSIILTMAPSETFLALLRGLDPVLALAPMQDVTDLAFWRVMARYGGAGVYLTGYFCVHGDLRLEKWILDSITQNPTGRPVVAQLIGNDVPSLVRVARELQQYPVAAIDLNLG